MNSQGATFKNMREVIYTFGRFNPPTLGHQRLVDFVLDQSIARGCDYSIRVSYGNDFDRNPLPIDRKIYWLQQAFPCVQFDACTHNQQSWFQHLVQLSKYYKKLTFVCGQDRLEEYKDRVHKYNNKDFVFEEIEFLCAGERKKCRGIEGISATSVRKHVLTNNFPAFKLATPSTLTLKDKKDLFYELESYLYDKHNGQRLNPRRPKG